MILPASMVSRRQRLMRSSNCPRYFVPATIPDTSRDNTLIFFREAGTALFAILPASPSTIAVFPTPGSPRMHGLFFVRLPRISITLSISFSRLNTGSNFPSSASCTRSRENLSKHGVSERPRSSFSLADIKSVFANSESICAISAASI